ncbi:uncharacterized protein [Triticum aestivum]|uniref:uncharacterized protein isoform X2 n=1 Tax=Triticum aestivum TaxID=4565 RepID=UPI001D022A28|nr:uncharacterized protein LOC123137546 isoform X2 [Triticum aestivum]
MGATSINRRIPLLDHIKLLALLFNVHGDADDDLGRDLCICLGSWHVLEHASDLCICLGSWHVLEHASGERKKLNLKKGREEL